MWTLLETFGLSPLPIQEKGAMGQGPPKRDLEETHEHRKAKEVLGTNEILLPAQRDNSVPHEERRLMAPEDPFYGESTRKPEAQFGDLNRSRTGSLMAIQPISGQSLQWLDSR